MDQVQASGMKSEEVISTADDTRQVQGYEVSSTSLYIRRNYSLYQRLTQCNSKELEPPSSPVEKKSIQDKWKIHPSPYPTKKHNKRFKSKTEVDKVCPEKTKGTGRPRRIRRKEPAEYPISESPLNKWLINTKAPEASSNHTVSENSCKKSAKKYANRPRNRRPRNPVCSSVDHSIQLRIRGKQQRVALQVKLMEWQQEIQALRSTVNKQRVRNENTLCVNERLQTLIEIKSMKSCADITDPAVAELLSGAILCSPGDIKRYPNNIQDVKVETEISGYNGLPKSMNSQSFANNVSTFVRVHTDTNNEIPWFRRDSEMSYESQRTDSIGDPDGSMSSSSTLSGNSDESNLHDGGQTAFFTGHTVDGIQPFRKLSTFCSAVM